MHTKNSALVEILPVNDFLVEIHKEDQDKYKVVLRDTLSKSVFGWAAPTLKEAKSKRMEIIYKLREDSLNGLLESRI